MYEMRSAIHAERSAREVHQRETPSLRRERVQGRELGLMSTPAAAVIAPTPAAGPLTRIRALLARRPAGVAQRAGRAAAA